MANTNKKSILVVGSIGLDSIASPAGKVENTLGGSANYFSIAASLFSSVAMVGVVGEDYDAKYFSLLKKHDIDYSGVRVEKGETFRWSGSYVEDLNEAVTLKTELNVFRNFNPELKKSHRDFEYLFLANIDPVLQLRVLDQMSAPKFVGLDTMNYWIDSKLSDLKKVLKRVDAFLLNETEALKISEESNIVNAAKKLVELGPKIVVIKRGEYGFFMYHDEQYFILPAFPISNVIDPTGAGDSFAGGFMGYLAQQNFLLKDKNANRTLRQACVFGTIVASFSVQDFGVTALARVKSGDIEARFNEYSKVITLE